MTSIMRSRTLSVVAPVGRCSNRQNRLVRSKISRSSTARPGRLALVVQARTSTRRSVTPDRIRTGHWSRGCNPLSRVPSRSGASKQCDHRQRLVRTATPKTITSITLGGSLWPKKLFNRESTQ
jgi:hypothetical protein